MSYEVFISHSSKDKKTADVICGYLEGRKVRCWIAPRDLLAGEQWASGIMNGLEQCRAMILVYSENANASQHVAREVERAAAKQIPIFPFRIDASDPAPEMEYFISNTHWLDAITAPVEQHLEQLHSAVRAQLDLPKDGSIPQPPTVAMDPRPEGPALDVALWYVEYAWKKWLHPAWQSFMSLSPTFKILLGGLAAILILLISLSSKLRPPSPDDIEEQMGKAMEQAEEFSRKYAEENEERQRVSNALIPLSRWASGYNFKDVTSPWWDQRYTAYQTRMGKVANLRGKAADDEIASLTKEKAMLEKWVESWRDLKPKIDQAVTRLAVKSALSEKRLQATSGLEDLERLAESARSSLLEGDLEGASKTLAPVSAATQTLEYPLEMTIVYATERRSYGRDPIFGDGAKVREFAAGFLKAWEHNNLGLRLGMTRAQVMEWANARGASWIGPDNMTAQYSRDSNAARMSFLVPSKADGSRMDGITLEFTHHFSAEMPSVVHTIDLNGRVKQEEIPSSRQIVEERLGQAVRLDSGRLVYSGSKLSSMNPHQSLFPEVVARAEPTYYDIDIACAQLEALSNDLWKQTVARSKNVSELPRNPILRDPVTRVDESSIVVKEFGWELPCGITVQRFEALVAKGGGTIKSISRGKYFTVKLPDGSSLTARAYDDARPQNLTNFQASYPFPQPQAVIETIETYIKRYGFPDTLTVDSRGVEFEYFTSAQKATLKVRLEVENAACKEARITAWSR